jgi:hypothetical protein
VHSTAEWASKNPATCFYCVFNGLRRRPPYSQCIKTFHLHWKRLKCYKLSDCICKLSHNLVATKDSDYCATLVRLFKGHCQERTLWRHHISHARTQSAKLSKTPHHRPHPPRTPPHKYGIYRFSCHHDRAPAWWAISFFVSELSSLVSGPLVQPYSSRQITTRTSPAWVVRIKMCRKWFLTYPPKSGPESSPNSNIPYAPIVHKPI